MFLMLRASSLGPSSFFTFHSCQRIYRFGAGRTLCSTSKKTGAQSCPLEHIPSIDVEESPPLMGERVHIKIGSPLSPMSATKTASELQSSDPGPTKPIQTTGNVLEKVYSPLEAPKCRPISQSPPSYAAGRPWSSENVQRINLPKYILSPLRRLRIEAVRAYRRWRRYERAQNASKKPRRGNYGNYKQAQNASKVIRPMKKFPLQDPASQLIQHFTVMATTDSVKRGWNSYVFLVDFISGSPVVQRHIQHIPFALLHRMVRLLSRNRPQTRRQFLQLLAILTYINYWGGKLKQHEWNALVVHAGSGWRKTRLWNIRKAIKVFNDMRVGRLPGSSDFLPPDREFLDGPPVEPDIYTYTSLLAIASRTVNNRHVHKISFMMNKAGLPPNRITHLSLMRYFTLKGDLDGIRATLMKMRQQGLELGLDGLNSCLWAYGRNARPDYVMMIYRILRHNVLPETDTQEDINHIIEQLGEEYIFVEPEMQPNEVTLTIIIQVMAYHGHFSSTLNVFMDMLSFNNVEKGAPLEKSSAGVYEPTSYKPSLAVFRAIFLGFSRHAKHTQDGSDWNMDNLSHMFDLFLELPSDSNLTHNTIYFVMLAFDKASGRDNKKLRCVWERMDRRFGIVLHNAHSVSRLARLQRLLFPEKEAIT